MVECEPEIYMESMYLCTIMRGFWLVKMIISQVKNTIFLPVFKNEFSH